MTLAERASVAMAELAALDLSMVRQKVVALEGWDGRIADYSELRYRRFLCLHRLDRTLPLAPPDDIDAWWHQHILFTRAYARDCERFFGEFLHHDPGSGTPSDTEAMAQAYARTARFYNEAFGEDYAATDPDGTVSNWLDLFS
jgi:hypothetical protein